MLHFCLLAEFTITRWHMKVEIMIFSEKKIIKIITNSASAILNMPKSLKLKMRILISVLNSFQLYHIAKEQDKQ